MLAKQFVFRVAKKLQTEVVDEVDPALRGPAQDDAVGVLDEFAVLQLALQQRLLGAPALGDVFGQDEFRRTPLIGDGVRATISTSMSVPSLVRCCQTPGQSPVSSTATTSSRRSGVSSLRRMSLTVMLRNSARE
jgi:hypothetical protein